MNLSVLLPSFGTDFPGALRLARALGFTQVDVVAALERPEAELEALADSGLTVSCAAVGRGLPKGHVLDAAALDDRRAALHAMKQQVSDAAILGATPAYVVPGFDASADGRLRFAEACRFLADHAGSRQVRLCVEHVPGRALPDVRQTLDWLDGVGHPNLFLLLDVGHCLISKEWAAVAVREAGARLGYVHFDDNDAANDLHLPLLEGCLTEADLRAVLAAFAVIRYDGGLCLELTPRGPEAAAAVRQGKELLERLLATEGTS